MSSNLPDIQQSIPLIQMPINQVGVENVEVPFKLQAKGGGYNDMIANVSMRSNLRNNVKGISMSRLLGTLEHYLKKPLKHILIHEILLELRENLENDEAYIKFDFRMPLYKRSPISERSFPIYYKCSFEGQLVKVIERGAPTDTFKFYQGVVVQYASYCPCSAELCNDLHDKGFGGFPHAQRSYAHILIESMPNYFIWLEDVIGTVESSIKTLPYPIIKRIDEQEIARIASENPIFVEDAIRAISQSIDEMEGVSDWYVKCVHEESIHTSEAIAINYKGINGGFDFRYNL